MRFSLENYKSKNGCLDPIKMSKIASKCHAETFIETGTYLGDTVQAMLGVFKNIFSIELSPELYKEAAARFSNDSRVKLLQGDSSKRLAEAARESCDTSTVFWLDAHWSGGNTAKAAENTPIIDELKSISACDLGPSIIMVDDLRYFIDVPAGFQTHDANYGYPLLHDFLMQVQSLWPDKVSVVNGDILFLFPKTTYSQLDITEVLSATDRLRSVKISSDERRFLEEIIANAEGDEREYILELPEIFHHSLQFGIGGDYVYWRALVYERSGQINKASDDFILARKCGLAIPQRSWE